jgi:hypothetical protein
MDEEVQGLVLVPFLDIVEKGKIAAENSKDAGPPKSGEMLKAADGLIKEGERALKRIEPLCKKYLEQYGRNFIDALKENGKS